MSTKEESSKKDQVKPKSNVIQSNTQDLDFPAEEVDRLAALIQKNSLNRNQLHSKNMLQLQRFIGNQAFCQFFIQRNITDPELQNKIRSHYSKSQLDPFLLENAIKSAFNQPNVTSFEEAIRVIDNEILHHQSIFEPMVHSVIRAVMKLEEELNKIMDTDKTLTYNNKINDPTEQLKRCLNVCQKLSSQETAIYLYTTYFYKPFNKYLRKDLKPEELSGSLNQLMSLVLNSINDAFANTPASGFIAKFRMELQPSWMGTPNIGAEVFFPGLTSTHPNLQGVNNMWGDIAEGTFGKVEDRLALLVFEGQSKMIRPQNKYFKNEIEDIFPPGMITKITSKYETKWTDESEKTWVVDVYHLKILPSVDVLKPGEVYLFNKEGRIEKSHQK